VSKMSRWNGQTDDSEGIVAGLTITPASYEGQSKTNGLEAIKSERWLESNRRFAGRGTLSPAGRCFPRTPAPRRHRTAWRA